MFNRLKMGGKIKILNRAKPLMRGQLVSKASADWPRLGEGCGETDGRQTLSRLDLAAQTGLLGSPARNKDGDVRATVCSGGGTAGAGGVEAVSKSSFMINKDLKGGAETTRKKRRRWWERKRERGRGRRTKSPGRSDPDSMATPAVSAAHPYGD